MSLKSQMKEADKSCDEWSRIIDQWIYSDRDRQIMKDHMLNGMHYEPIAEKYDLPTTQVQDIISTEKVWLFGHINR